MRCLSVQQPWAWLIVHGYKGIENRSWNTAVRGAIAIHAGLNYDGAAEHWIRHRFPEIPLPQRAVLQFGGIVGTATLTKVVRMSRDRWFFGPFGFVLEEQRPTEFVPLRGHLGFFAIDDNLVRPIASSERKA